MRFSYGRLWLVAVVAALGVGACTLGDESSEPPVPVQPGPDVSVAFEHEGTLTLAPGETTTVTVATDPPDRYEVSFYLVGNSLDASLSQSTVLADPGGRASITLRAPNGSTNFGLRATVDEAAAADLQVAVSDKGFGSLLVVPDYGGKRETELWVAKVVSGTSCAALSATLPQDPAGALSANGEPGESLEIPIAPVGPNLSIVVLGGHYMFGCADEPNLVAEETTEVRVHVVDKAIDTSEALLDAELSFEPEAGPWQELLDGSLQLMLDGLLGDHPDEATALLAAMQDHAGEPAQFETASDQLSWPDGVTAHLAAGNVSLAQTIGTWAADGLALPSDGIAGRLEAVDEPGWALFTLTQFGVLSPEDAGVPAEYLMSLSADADDQISLGGVLFWLPSRYIGQAAALAAAESHPDQADPGEALSEIVDCSTLGATLGGYGSCDPTCMAGLCAAGLAQIWIGVLDASPEAGLVGEVSLQATGDARFDDWAVLTGFEGDWLGNADNGLLDAKVGGVISAEEAEDSPAQ